MGLFLLIVVPRTSNFLTMADQQERGFQKQPTIFQNQKRLPGAKKTTLKRYTRTVGLGFRMPAEAREGNYIDKKCPFVGKVSIRGRILTGVLSKTVKFNTLKVSRASGNKK